MGGREAVGEMWATTTAALESDAGACVCGQGGSLIVSVGSIDLCAPSLGCRARWSRWHHEVGAGECVSGVLIAVR